VTVVRGKTEGEEAAVVGRGCRELVSAGEVWEKLVGSDNAAGNGPLHGVAREIKGAGVGSEPGHIRRRRGAAGDERKNGA